MKRILIIEDDSSLQQIYKETLAEEGFTIDAAGTAKEGLEKAGASRPDLILLDIMLPGGMNGFDFLEQLKRDPTLATIPVVVLTNLDTEKETAMSVGAVDYIVKANTPIHEVVEKVKRYLS